LEINFAGGCEIKIQSGESLFGVSDAGIKKTVSNG